MLEWLPPSCSNTCNHGVLREPGALTHQEHHSTGPGPTSVCLPGKPLHWRRHQHSSAKHPDTSEELNCYVRVLFVDFSSTFTAIIPHKLVNKARDPGLWFTPVLMDHGLSLTSSTASENLKHISATLILNTGTPQGCVLRPMLFTLFTLDFPIYTSNSIKICWRHNCGGPDYRQWGDSAQAWGDPSC